MPLWFFPIEINSPRPYNKGECPFAPENIMNVEEPKNTEEDKLRQEEIEYLKGLFGESLVDFGPGIGWAIITDKRVLLYNI